MEKPLIKKSLFDKVNQVYEFDDVHYFHWNVEVGVGKSEILGMKLMLPLVKLNDLEPLKVIKKSKSEFNILTRFHYEILVLFNQPYLKNNKPVVEFFIGSHSPLIYSGIKESIESGFISKIKRGFDSRKLNYALMLMVFYQNLVSKRLFSFLTDEEVGEYPNIICESPSTEALFIPERMTYMVWIGRLPEHDELVEIRFYSQ